MARIEQWLNPEGRALLSMEDVVYAWGNRQGTKLAWERMQPGDTIIFYENRTFTMIGEIYYKQHNRDLSLALWPPDENYNPWEFTFFIRNIRDINVPAQVFNELVGFKNNFVIQGFIELQEFRQKGIIEKFGSIEKFFGYFPDHNPLSAPLSTEAIHVNLPKEIDVEIIHDPEVSPLQEYKKSTKERKITKINYLERNRQNAITGSKGEALVEREERKRLRSEGRPDLAQKVKRISFENDAVGYDILSYEKDERIRYIEVKTTTAKDGLVHFYMSANEYKQAHLLENYFVYWVEGILTDKPRITIFSEPFADGKFAIHTDTYVFDGKRKK